MKYILIICAFLVGCSQQTEEKNISHPQEVADAITIVLSTKEESPEFRSAFQKLKDYDDSMTREISAMENIITGEGVSDEICGFPRLNIRVDFRNDTFVSSSRIENK